jgi:hypothetical protein
MHYLKAFASLFLLALPVAISGKLEESVLLKLDGTLPLNQRLVV